jgi:hypothetical protein
MILHPARELWLRYEPIHAVTYFAPESHQAARDAGLKGFWMGYFGFRAAPMGAVSSGVVIATFANFAPQMVRRAIPDAWSFASPDVLVEVRAEAAARALRRVVPDVDEVAEIAMPLLERVQGAADPMSRPLFAANAELELPQDPVSRLWQLCTSLREHRGDIHVTILASEGVSGPEALQLMGAERGYSDEVFLLSRGWDAEPWEAAFDALAERGLVTKEGLTGPGRHLRQHIEHLTDELAMVPYVVLSDAERADLATALERAARAIHAEGAIPEVNPIGLPSLD